MEQNETLNTLQNYAKTKESPVDYCSLGDEYNNIEGMQDAAKREYQHAFNYDENHRFPLACIALGQIAEKEKEEDEAIKYYKYVCEKEDTYYLETYKKEKEQNKLSFLSKGVDDVIQLIESSYAEACFLLGKLYERKGNTEALVEAKKWLRIAVERGHLAAKDSLVAIEKKDNIETVVNNLKKSEIVGEHQRGKRWYIICMGLFAVMIAGFAAYLIWNVNSIDDIQANYWAHITIRILISMSFLSMIFILMNQMARTRKSLVLLSKEIQEYAYIGELLKGKVSVSIDTLETNKAIDKTFSDMIQLHLDIQKQRLEKEDHSEIKDITPEMLNFFKDNTTSMLGSYNEMHKSLMETQISILQLLKENKDDKKKSTS